MVKKTISAKIEVILKKEADKVAKKRGITFSRLVETALIHELNRNSVDNGLLAELKDIQEYINHKIDDLEVINDTDIKISVKDEHYYVQQLKQKHEQRGFITAEVVLATSKKVGLSFGEFKKLLDEDVYEFKIK